MHFKALLYTASRLPYSCGHYGYFAGLEKSWRPSGAEVELYLITLCAKKGGVKRAKKSKNPDGIQWNIIILTIFRKFQYTLTIRKAPRAECARKYMFLNMFEIT